MVFSTEYSLWYTLICIALAGVYAYFFYFFRDRTFIEIEPWKKFLLAGLRFVSIFILSFLLLGPLLELFKQTEEKPVVVIAQDNSSSILQKDSLFYRNEYPQKLNNLIKKLENNYNVKVLSFGDHTKAGFEGDFKDKETDISQALQEIQTKYSNKNLGAIVLATDGIYNKGSNPLYSIKKSGTSLFTIALGDPTIKKDLLIKQLNYNKTAYLGNDFPLNITIRARKCVGQSTLQVKKGSQLIFEKKINIGSDNYNEEIPVTITAKEKGLNKFDIELSPVEGEQNTFNNHASAYIDVVEDKEKILLLTAFPHPDIGAINQIINNHDNYELTVAEAAKFTGNVSAYNLVILYQLPSVNNPAQEILQKIRTAKLPVFYFLGAQTNIRSFNSLNAGVTIDGNGTSLMEASGVINPAFTLFTTTEKTAPSLISFPPLICLQGNYRKTKGNDLLRQQISGVNMEQPLLSFSDDDGMRTAILCGEGFWRWRLAEFKDNAASEVCDELLTKTLQYLSVKDTKKRFRIITSQRFNENEALQFQAEYYNESYELVNEPEIKLDLRDSKGKHFEYTFSKTGKSYSLTAGVFPPGKYSFTATLAASGVNYTEKGEIDVLPLRVESLETTADHGLLSLMAQENNGIMVYPDKMESLVDLIGTNKEIHTIVHADKELQELIRMKWLCFLVVILLGIEWFLRKRFGGY